MPSRTVTESEVVVCVNIGVSRSTRFVIQRAAERVSPQSLSDVSEELLELEEADEPEVDEFVDDAFEADERERRRVACTCSGASAERPT
jgi:hypothetical protein